MAHLPYQAPDAYGAGYAVGFDQPDNAHLERPQPLYASSYRAQQRQHAHQHHQQQAFPTPISIPAPRSPPLVEDAPKKPLTLACFFCRKRKIACGSPPPGKKDRTCNQCERRNLQCVYPVNSRRGTRQRELEAFAYPA
ncbi:hypothetical protein BDW22DRAFT_1338204 [Trametopsis cervina]|nr:hypothetical protein BDW22DRAFT_1338204 [Trametopsis cervina]